MWPIDRTLTGMTTLDQSGPMDGEGVLHIAQISMKYSLVSYPGHPFFGGGSLTLL